MLGYILFVVLLLCSGLIANRKVKLTYLFLVITFFSSIRYGIAYDYYEYLETATGDRSTYGVELIPRLMIDISRDTIPFLFFFFSSLFISLFYYLSILKGGRYNLEEVLFYVAFPFLFIDQLGIIRQGMASAVIFLAIVIDKKHYLLRILLIALAFLCHQSAIIGLLLLVPWYKFNKKTLWFIFAASFVIGPIIVSFLSMIAGMGFGGELISNKAIRYLEDSSAVAGNIIKYLMYFIVLVILCNYNRLIKYDQNNKYYIGLIVLGIALYSIFSFHISLGKRLCMFFFTPVVFIMPQLSRIYKVPRAIYVFLCIILFALTIYIGSGSTRPEDPPGYSVTYPYRTIFDFIN